jgi:hypothetical protein
MVEPETEPDFAAIVVVPAATPVTKPCEPSAFEIFATAVLLDVHVEVEVRSRCVPSENVPVAMNCRVLPAITVELAGVTSIDTRTAAVTVSVVEPETEPNCALICVVPGNAPMATPCEPAAFEIVATEAWLDAHVQVEVRF